MLQQPRTESWLDRIIRIVRQKMVARVNHLDDPAEAIDVVMAQQLEAIARTRADLANVASGEKRLGMLLDDLEQRARAHAQDARDQHTRGDRHAAEVAIRRAISTEHLAVAARENRDEVEAQRLAVEALLEEMRAQYERLRLRRESVRAMATAARALSAGHESLAPIGPEGSDREALLERAHETLADLRARAIALADLRKSGALDPVGASEFDPRGISEAEVRKRLEELG